MAHLRPCSSRYALLLLAVLAAALPPTTARAAEADGGDYVLIGWNDLGMHCSNRNFADLTVLPPYNTVWATLIRRGSSTEPPQVVASGYRVGYSIVDNTYSVGKTDFWTYAPQVFGVALPPNVGLTGKGLTGDMDVAADHFHVEGIPLTPFTDSDLTHEQPYQLGRLTAYDGTNNMVASTEIVVPVSNEMMCSNCHHPRTGESVEHAILRKHDSEEGTNLANSTPVLCAGCHGSNALGLPGNPELGSLSQVMHVKHAEYTDDCYQCHPGPNTQCLRDVMSTQYGMTCQDCHGSMLEVGTSLAEGQREAWLEEPRCGTCHGVAYSEAPNTLFRNSHNGHGNLYCPTCHSSPHAILPSREERDNRQNTALQGHAGTLDRCDVCHGVTPAGAGPHGMMVTAVGDGAHDARAVLLSPAPNPFGARTEISYRVVDESPIRLSIYDVSGREIRVLTANAQTPGQHTLVWDGAESSGARAPSGMYFVRLATGGRTATSKLMKLDR
jgi:hypothetical protein